ncbi:MAG: TRAP transporter large permease [Deltaproteobacteria bacterium]|nr:TRAP transporter large permease [Deltaproteobacteria bacterium]
MDAVIVIALLLFLLFMRIPVYLSLFIAGVAGILLFTDLEITFVAQTMVKKLDKFSLLAIPFFILLGSVMVRGRSAGLLVELARKMVCFLPGGLAISGVIASAAFGAISGSSISTIVTIGGVVFPYLDKYKYPRSFSVGLLTSSSILGVIVPPSIIMIICADTAGVSVVRLFAAGYLPALVIVAALSLYAYWVSRRRGLGKQAMEPFSFYELGKAARASIWPIFIIVLLFAGIYSGAFTITEASVVSCMLAIIVECVIYRAVRLNELWQEIIAAAYISGALVITVSGAGVLSEFITLQGIPNRIMELSMQYLPNWWTLLIFANFLLLLVGTFLEPIGAIMILVPILVPVATGFGIDPIHLCMIVTLALTIGYITPPLGLLLYASAAITREDFVFVTKSIMPTLMVYVVCLFLISFVPWLSTYMPRLIFGN